MYSMGPIYRFTVGGQGRGVEGAPLLPWPPGVRAEESHWWPGASCPWGDLGVGSWSALGLGGQAGAAGSGVGCWQAGSGPRSSHLWGGSGLSQALGSLAWRLLLSTALSDPKAAKPQGTCSNDTVLRPEPPTQGWWPGEMVARGLHASNQAWQP